VKPNVLLAETRTPDGAVLTLHRHDGHYQLRVNGHGLMTTRQTRSEAELAERGCATIRGDHPPRVLIGGLGFGFTLRRVLELLPTAQVQVAELLPDIVVWNRAHLRAVNGALLDDPRVEVLVDDVHTVMAVAPPATYDAILLDVDNGPEPLVDARNAQLYGFAGLRLLSHVLRPGGRAAFWSASSDRPFLRRLIRAGFTAEARRSRPYVQAKRAIYTLILADRPA
jgi:spermidine synthase